MSPLLDKETQRHLSKLDRSGVLVQPTGVLIVTRLPCLISRQWLLAIHSDAYVVMLPRRLKFITADGRETTSKWDSMVAIWNAKPEHTRNVAPGRSRLDGCHR
jgi:hypothetical protein